MKILVFELDKKLFGVNISNVLSIEKNIRIVPIPNAPSYIDGMTRLRDQVMPVYSLAKKFGYELSEGDQDYVILELNQKNLVLHVGKVQEMLEVGEEQITPIEDSIIKEQKDLYQIISKEKELIVLVDAAFILTEQDRQCLKSAEDEGGHLWEKE